MRACYSKHLGTYVGLDNNNGGEFGKANKKSTLSTTSTTPTFTSIGASTLGYNNLVAKLDSGIKYIPNTNRQVPDLIGSTISVSYRLLKLKIELLNLFAIIPKGLLTWNSSTTTSNISSNSNVNELNETKVDADPASKENIPTTNQEPISQDSTVTSQESTTQEPTVESIQMKVEKYIKNVQSCSTPSELFNLIRYLEKLLPRVALFNFPAICSGDNLKLNSNDNDSKENNNNSNNSNNSIITTSIVGTYLYSLDRWIRYEDIPLDLCYEGVEYRPRLVYTPRCILTPTCSKYFHHSGKCDFVVSIGDSRYREILPRGMQNLHSNSNVNVNANAPSFSNQSFQKSLPPAGALYTLQQQQQPQQQYQQQQQFQQNRYYDPYQSRFNVTNNFMSTGMRPYDPFSDPFSLESIQPYIPKREEIKTSEWI